MRDDWRNRSPQRGIEGCAPLDRRCDYPSPWLEMEAVGTFWVIGNVVCSLRDLWLAAQGRIAG